MKSIMTFRQSINNARSRFYNVVTDYKIVKIYSLAAMVLYLLLLLIAVLIAVFFGPRGYTIWTHMISDLGGSRHTPVPIIYDIACLIAGTLTIPLAFYTENFFAPLPEKDGKAHRISRLRFRLSSYAFFFSIMGSFALFGNGIFSEDRNFPVLDFASIHDIVSFFAFGGFSLGAFFLGWLVLLYNTKIPKILGIYGIIVPISMFFAFLLTMEPLIEWCLLFSILIWIMPLCLLVMQKPELDPK